MEAAKVSNSTSPQISAASVGKIEFANSLRAPACLMVLAFHYLLCFWYAREPVVAIIAGLPIVPVETHAIPKYVTFLDHFGFLFYWGFTGVSLFFLISGFVIPFSLAKTDRIGFFIARFFRLFPTYVLTLSLTFLIIWLADVYFGREFPHSLKTILLHYLVGIRDILDSFMVDGVSWTLNIEVKFYLICLLMLYAIRRGSLMIFLFPVLYALTVYYFLPVVDPKKISLAWVLMSDSPYIIYLFIGVVFHYLFRKIISLQTALVLMVVLLGLSLLILKTSFGLIRDTRVAPSLIAGLLIFGFAFFCPRFFRGNRIVNFFANISYPLYLIHYVPGTVILRVFLDLGLKTWYSYIIITILMVGLSYLIHKTIEVPTQMLGKIFPRYLKDRTDWLRFKLISVFSLKTAQ